MDLVKIGDFIQRKRKEKNLTQGELAEKLGISDRAVSKWENGVCLPDASNVTELCKLLDITVNDLYSGETVDEEDYRRKYEENLVAFAKEKEKTDKIFLKIEVVVIVLSIMLYLVAALFGALAPMPDWARIVLCVGGIALMTPGILVGVWLERSAGYYECPVCGNHYVPKFTLGYIFSLHVGLTRYLKCPACGKKSWQKKVMRKK